MEMVAFLLFIVVCAGFLIWHSSRSRAGKSLSATGRKSVNAEDDKLFTPADNVLSHRDELWEHRRHAASSDVVRTNRFVLKSEASREPEYDGYSRRDRHHLTSDPTHVKDDGHIDDLSGGVVQ